MRRRRRNGEGKPSQSPCGWHAWHDGGAWHIVAVERDGCGKRFAYLPETGQQVVCMLEDLVWLGPMA